MYPSVVDPLKITGVILFFLIFGALFSDLVNASTLNATDGAGGTEFKPLFDFLSGAATGYLGRSIAIIGGLIGLGLGAIMGKGIPALVGVILAIFGVLGPSLINTIFTAALI